MKRKVMVKKLKTFLSCFIIAAFIAAILSACQSMSDQQADKSYSAPKTGEEDPGTNAEYEYSKRAPDESIIAQSDSDIQIQFSEEIGGANYKDTYSKDASVHSMKKIENYPVEDFNTESYNAIYENKFLDTLNSPLSTFSIDVDTASYSNIRRFLNSSRKPPADAVRIEEMINYFTYDYPKPQNEDPFSITTEIAKCPWNPKNNLMLVGLQAEKLQTEDMPPNNLVFLLDVSGSMDEPNKLPLLKSAFKLLVNKLRDQDRVSIVVYAGAAGLVLDSTPGSEKDKILDALSNLEAGGSTAGAEGINMAYRVAEENFIPSGNNRVILATDGDFNVGVSSDAELVRLIEKKRNDGIFLTVLGFGMGNYKDSKMEGLADKGNGNYA
ncbi:MAG: vWA domain-containing protein, partial [Bacillota bacterium]